MVTYGPYGVNVPLNYDYQKPDLINTGARLIKELAPLASQTQIVVRLRFRASQIAPNSPYGPYSYTWLDPIVEALNKNNLITLLSIEGPEPVHGRATSDWGRGKCPGSDHCIHPYILPAEWAIFATDVARHYTNNAAGLHIEIIECGNEDYNQDPHKCSSPQLPLCNNPVAAAETASLIKATLQKLGTSIQVGAPASQSIDNLCNSGNDNACAWWKGFFKRQQTAQQTADYVNFHYYGKGVSCCTGPVCFDRKHLTPCYTPKALANYIWLLQQHPLYHGPITPTWLTEVGFNVHGPHPCTCQNYNGGVLDFYVQAQLLTDMMDVGRTSRGKIQTICWWNMDFGDKGYSLVWENTKPPHKLIVRPAYDAYQDYIKNHPTW